MSVRRTGDGVLPPQDDVAIENVRDSAQVNGSGSQRNVDGGGSQQARVCEQRVPNNSVSHQSLEKLKGRDDYAAWAFGMRMVMIKEGTWRAINSPDNVQISDDLSDRALATICLSIERYNYSLVQNARTAKQAWTSLRTAFQDSGKYRKISLLRKLMRLELEDCSSVEEYVDEILTTSQKLQEIGFPLDDEWMSLILMMGLPKRYEPMVMGMDASGVKWTADWVKSKILQDVSIESGSRAGGSSGALATSCPKQVVKKKDKSNMKCFKDKAALVGAKQVSQSIYVADASEIAVVAVGNVELNAEVDDLAVNLLSVSRICQKGYCINFTKDACEVKHESTGEVIATEREKDGLYQLNQVGQSSACVARPATNLELWHRRLGHLNVDSVKRLPAMVTGMETPNGKMSTCVPCVEGKHQRSPFKSSGSKAREVLEVIHSDVCGAMEKPSLGGNKYFVTFIDDASRMTFVYFLKSKKDVFEAFKEFKTYSETQTGRKLKCLRTDNGGEYVGKHVVEFLKTHGIRHETTVPHNPEQNGLAERMNRTIQERARCLLFEGKMDKRFWAEAASTAVYLINQQEQCHMFRRLSVRSGTPSQYHAF
ncbi:uncharacterized protein LOC134209531 [Armigeres subalbatus]|uniref:uncharacterized protein LOC134209531 n=1 Tax=Armigeres subalbatus TaxID=124917 RepID=UPI002ED1B5AC